MPLGAFRQSLNLANVVAPSWPTNRYGGEIQVTGAATLNTTNKKFGTASGNFTSGGSLTYKQFDANTFASSGNYTIEFWFMIPSAVTGQKSLFTVSGAGSVSLRPQGGNVYDIEYTFEGENWNTNGGTAQTLTYGVWYHCAIVRYTTGPTTNIFFNGNRRSNRAATHTRPFGTGTSVDLLINGGQNLIYLDEIRLSNSSRYANAATYVIPGTRFVNDANTKLLMHMDGTNGSNQFADDNATPTAPTGITFPATNTSTGTTITVPAGAAAGDLAFLFDTSTTVTDTIPSEWSRISGLTTTGIRTNITYKLLTSGDLGATITGMAGTTRKSMIICRGNTAINEAIAVLNGSQATTGTPSSQTIAISSIAKPHLAFAVLGASASNPSKSWTQTGASVNLLNSFSGGGVAVYYQSNDVGSGAGNATVTMGDGGSNTFNTIYVTIK
jgi:hypothetical protein